MAETEIGIELTGRSGSTYRLERYLGGGQTAHVYQATVQSVNPQRNGTSVAVKMMLAGLDAETQRRFWQEETVLFRLAAGLDKPSAGQPLVPEVWDSGDSFGGSFLVMTLAQGQPLDELLRAGARWNEEDALHLIGQLAAVFRSLHTNLQRTYLDFQPRNIFWHAESRSICVIDWNLLSRSYGPAQGEQQSTDAANEALHAYGNDLLLIARLLYRLLLGSEPTGYSKLEIASPERWKQLTWSMRILLWDLLNPESPYLADIKEFCEHIDKEIGRRKGSGEELLKEAVEIVESIENLKKPEGKTAGPRKAMELREKAANLLELVEQKGVNRSWTRILENLHEALQSSDEGATYMGRGQALLRAGDRAEATEYFHEGIPMATTVEERLQCWRWWLLCTSSLPKEEDDRITSLLAQVQEVIPPQPVAEEMAELFKNALPWNPIIPLLQEIVAQFRLVDLIGLNIPAIDDKAKLTQQLEIGKAAQADLNNLYEAAGKYRYSDSAWEALGSGDAIQGALEKLSERLDLLSALAGELDAINSPLAALALIEEYPKYAKEPVLAFDFLKKVPDWLENEAYLSPALDLLHRLELQVRPGKLQTEIGIYCRKLHWLITAQYLISQLETLDTKPSEEYVRHLSLMAKLKDDKTGLGASEQNQSATTGQSIVTSYIPALDQATSILKLAHREVAEAPKLMIALVSRLVNASIVLRISTTTLTEWLAEAYPGEEQRLFTKKKLSDETEKTRQELATLEKQKQEDETAHLKRLVELEANYAARETELAEQVKLAEENKHEAISAYAAEEREAKQKLAKAIEELTNKHDMEKQRLDSRLRDEQKKLENVGDEYEKEKTFQQNRAADYKRQANEKADELNRIKAEFTELEKQRPEYERQIARAKQDTQSAQATLVQAQKEQKQKEQELNDSHNALNSILLSIEEQERQKNANEQVLVKLQKEIGNLQKQRDYEIAALELLKTGRDVEESRKSQVQKSTATPVASTIIRGQEYNLATPVQISHNQPKSFIINAELTETVRQSDTNYRDFQRAVSPGAIDLATGLIHVAALYSCWERATHEQRENAPKDVELVTEIKQKWEECKKTYLERVSSYMSTGYGNEQAMGQTRSVPPSHKLSYRGNQ